MVVACKNEYSSLFTIALVEQLLIALALGRGRFKVGNAPSFNDLQEVPTYIPSAVKCFSQIICVIQFFHLKVYRAVSISE